MNTHQERTLAAWRRAIACLTDRFGVTAGSPGQLTGVDLSALAAPTTALANTLARAEGHAREQQTNTAQTTGAARELKPLRNELASIARSVAGVARSLRGTVPGIGVIATAPRGRRYSTFVVETDAYARQVEVYAPVLIEHGQPHDVVQQLDTATAALKQSIAQRGTALSEQAGSTTGLTAEIRIGQKLVAAIDANLTRLLRDHPADLAVWKRAKRVGLSVGAPSDSGASDVPSIAPATASVPGVTAGTSPAAAAAAEPLRTAA